MLLEVAHPRSGGGPARTGDLRRTGAGPRARAHLPHHAAGAVERARRRPHRRADARDPREVREVPGAADGVDRHRRDGRALRPAGHRSPGTTDGELVIRDRRTPPCSPRSPAARKVGQFLGMRASAPSGRCMPWARGQVKQELLKLGWPAEDLRRLHARHPARDRAHPGRLAPARRTRRRRSTTSSPADRASWCCPAARARRWSAPARWRAPTRRPSSWSRTRCRARQWRSRAAQAHHPHRGRDRRVLGPGQRDQAGHDRDVPDPDREAERRVRPPRAARRARLGPRSSTTRCTCCPPRCSS